MSIQPAISYHGPILPVAARGRKQVQIALACFGLAALGSLYLLGGAGRFLAIGVGGVAAAGLTLYDIRVGLGLFLLLAGLSPEFSVHAGATMDNLRAEDLLFPVLLASWAVRSATRHERPSFRTPLTAPMVAITLWGVAVTLLGLAQETVPHGSTALFRFLKYSEYYLIFFLVYNNVRSFADARALVVAFIAVAALTGLFSIARGAVAWQQAGDDFARASGPRGENYNTLVGYLMQGLMVAAATALSSRRIHWRLPLGLAALAILAAVFYTHSREGYVMLAAGGAFLAGKRYRSVLIAGLALWVLSPLLLPGSVRERVHDTAYQIRVAQTDNPGSNSMTARLYAWRYRWNGWFVEQPVQGHGIGSIPFTVDNQYLLTLVETGLIGLVLFAWLITSLWLLLSRAARDHPDTFAGVLAIGALGALFSLLVQGWAATSFGTIRTMEPWWFLCGLAMAAVRLAGASSAAAVGATRASGGVSS